MRLTTVGTGTGAPHPTRVCAGHLVELGDATVLLDCGSGVVHRMAAMGAPWPTITHVALTHFHADHVSDLVMLIFAWRWGQLPPRNEPVTIIGPPGVAALLERLAAAFGSWVVAPGYPLAVREVDRDTPIEIGGNAVLTCHPVPHTMESVAYSLAQGDRRIVYTGDLGFAEDVGRWARGSDVLLTECSLPETQAIPEHLTPRQAGALAAIADPALLVLTHFYPPVEATDVVSQVAEHFAGPVVLATDGWSIEL